MADIGKTERFIPLEIYKNLQKLVLYRKIQTNHKFVDFEEFKRNFNSNEYLIVEGTRNDAHGLRSSYIVLMAPESKFATKTMDFKKLISALDLSKNKGNNEILFISENKLSIFIVKVLQEYKTLYPSLYIDHHTYPKFTLVIPEHSKVPKHEIMTIDEVIEYCRDNYIQKENSPKILHTDPVVVWLGARIGDFMRIHRLSETSGISIVYRLVVRNY
jgi:DNA-directed RNA polymerase subunit H